MVVLADGRWAVLEPLVEACRRPAEVRPSHRRRTIRAILRNEDAAKWRPWAGPAVVWPHFLALALIGSVAFGYALACFRPTIGTMA
jgi:hypothetical protein